MTINSFWISGELQPVNHLTIKSFLSHGYEFHLYTYDRNLTVNYEANGLTILDARTIMPESEIYYYQNMMEGKPHFKFGGIAERLKAEMLYQLGGWHVDLDVTCLKSFDDLTSEYVFRPLRNSIIGNIIKAPKHSQFALDYLNWTKTINEDNEVWSKSHEGLGTAMKDNGLEDFIVGEYVFGVDELEWFEPLYKPLEYDYQIKHIENSYAIHWCQAWSVELGYDKNHQQSYFESLLKKYNV